MLQVRWVKKCFFFKTLCNTWYFIYEAPPVGLEKMFTVVKMCCCSLVPPPCHVWFCFDHHTREHDVSSSHCQWVFLFLFYFNKSRRMFCLFTDLIQLQWFNNWEKLKELLISWTIIFPQNTACEVLDFTHLYKFINFFLLDLSLIQYTAVYS